MQTAIERITTRAANIAAGRDPRVQPGRPERLSEAASVGDTVAQGDLYLMVVDRVPEHYETVKRPKKTDAQLVPGVTQGARHCLSDVRAVSLYRPQGWGQDDASLLGPCFVVKREVTVQHPTHGDVTIPAGFTILCGYQPEFDAEQRRERRNAD